MGVFGAVPAIVCEAIAAGSGAVTVDVAGTLMSFVPDATRDTPQTWWTRLGVFVETEGLVTSRHGTSHLRDESGWRLNRLRFTDYLPGAKVLIWPTAYTVFIYVKQGLGKKEAAKAVRLALAASGRKPLNPAHSAILGIGVAGGLHLPLWVSHWPLPRGAVHAACGALSLTIVGAAGSLILQWPATGHAPAVSSPLPTVQPAQAATMPPFRPHQRATARPAPSTFVVPRTPRLVPRAAATTPPPVQPPAPTTSATPVPAPLPSGVPQPMPSSQVPGPQPSGVMSTSASLTWWWWLPGRIVLPLPSAGS